MNKLFFIILFSLSTSIAIGQNTELSALLREAEENNISLKAARESITAAGYEISAGNTLDATSVEYSPFFRKGASGVASSELIVSQEFDFPTLYASRNKAGKLQGNALETNYATMRRDILLNVSQTYLDLVGFNKVREVLEERIMIADTLLSLFNKRMDAGYATAIDINRIKMEQMDLKTALIQNDADHRNALTLLASLCGRHDLEVPIKADSYPYAMTGEQPERIISDYLDNDTGIKSAQAELMATTEEVKVARQGWLPKLTAGYRRNTELDEASNGFVIGAAFPLFSTGKQVKAASARRAAAQLSLEDTRLKAMAEVKSSVNELMQLREALKVTDLSLLRETLQLMRKAVDEGAMTATEYYVEADNIYQKIADYNALENRLHKTLAVLAKNTL